MIRRITSIITAQRFLAGMNQIQLTILELSNLGYTIGSFSTIQYAKVGQLKVNNNQVMCHLSIKLSDTFDQNPPCTFDKIRGKHIPMKSAHMA